MERPLLEAFSKTRDTPEHVQCIGSMGSVRKSYPNDYTKVEHQVINY